MGFSCVRPGLRMWWAPSLVGVRQPGCTNPGSIRSAEPLASSILRECDLYNSVLCLASATRGGRVDLRHLGRICDDDQS